MLARRQSFAPILPLHRKFEVYRAQRKMSSSRLSNNSAGNFVSQTQRTVFVTDHSLARIRSSSRVKCKFIIPLTKYCAANNPTTLKVQTHQYQLHTSIQPDINLLRQWLECTECSFLWSRCSWHALFLVPQMSMLPNECLNITRRAKETAEEKEKDQALITTYPCRCLCLCLCLMEVKEAKVAAKAAVKAAVKAANLRKARRKALKKTQRRDRRKAETPTSLWMVSSIIYSKEDKSRRELNFIFHHLQDNQVDPPVPRHQQLHHLRLPTPFPFARLPLHYSMMGTFPEFPTMMNLLPLPRLRVCI